MKIIWTLTAAVLAFGPAYASTPSAEELPPEGESIETDRQRDNRLTIPVSIDGQGPYRFIVDTGSERTVISRELAERLALDPSDDVWLTTVVDVAQVPTVIIPRLDLGRRSVDTIQAPALAQQNLGAEGMIGVDALEDQQVVLDFARGEMTISDAATEEQRQEDENLIVVTAHSRFGRLVLADVRFEGTRVMAIIDTGSSVSIGNIALRDRLVRRGRLDPENQLNVIAVTGATMAVNYTVTDRLSIDDIMMTGLPVAFADIELFRSLDLVDRPAMLLGMNALRSFERVTINFADRQIRFRLPTGATGEPDLLLAALTGDAYSDAD